MSNNSKESSSSAPASELMLHPWCKYLSDWKTAKTTAWKYEKNLEKKILKNFSNENIFPPKYFKIILEYLPTVESVKRRKKTFESCFKEMKAEQKKARNEIIAFNKLADPNFDAEAEGAISESEIESYLSKSTSFQRCRIICEMLMVIDQASSQKMFTLKELKEFKEKQVEEIKKTEEKTEETEAKENEIEVDEEKEEEDPRMKIDEEEENQQPERVKIPSAIIPQKEKKFDKKKEENGKKFSFTSNSNANNKKQKFSKPNDNNSKTEQNKNNDKKRKFGDFASNDKKHESFNGNNNNNKKDFNNKKDNFKNLGVGVQLQKKNEAREKLEPDAKKQKTNSAYADFLARFGGKK